MWVTLDKGTEIMIFSGKNFYPKYYYVIQYGNTSVFKTCRLQVMDFTKNNVTPFKIL